MELNRVREAIRVSEESRRRATVRTGRTPLRDHGRDGARAHGQVKMEAKAVSTLIEAERRSARSVRDNKFVRERLRREHRVTEPQIPPFAGRLGCWTSV